MKKLRIQYLDILRAMACTFVVAIHTILGWTDIYTGNHNTRMLIDISIIESLFRIAVPIFLMISGALLLRKEKELGWRKIGSYITRMMLVLATFGLAYCTIENFMNGNRGLTLALNSVLNLLSGKSWNVMWYVYMVIGIYVLTPILKKYTDNCEKKDYRIILLILLTVGSIIPTINVFTGAKLTQFYLGGMIYVFYYLLGQYAYRYNYPNRLIIPIGIIGIVGTAAMYLLNIPYTGNNLESIFIVITAFAVFSLIKNWNPQSNKVIDFIAKYSFGIYLVHTFWLNVLNKGLHIYPDFLPPVIGELAVFAYALIASIVSCLILYRLPVFKKILR